MPRAVKGPDKSVRYLVEKNAAMDNLEEVLNVLGRIWPVKSPNWITNALPELNHIMDRDINLLSGGELQRFAIGTVCVQQADV